MAQDTLASDESVIKEFPDGGRAVKIGYRNADYRYDVPDGDGGFDSRLFRRERAALVIGNLRAKSDYSEADQEIPLPVVLEGKKAVASYLYTEGDLSLHGVGKAMGLKKNTVSQYLTDYLKGRSE